MWNFRQVMWVDIALVEAKEVEATNQTIDCCQLTMIDCVCCSCMCSPVSLCLPLKVVSWNSLSVCSLPPWTKPWSSGLLKRDLESGWSRWVLTWIPGGCMSVYQSLSEGNTQPCRPTHQFFTLFRLASLSVALDMIRSQSPPLVFSLLLSMPLWRFSTLTDIEVSGIEVITVTDSDEEAPSLAHHCEFRQAEDVLPHLPYLSLTHTEPPLLWPIPQHIRQGMERLGGRHARAFACTAFPLIIFFPTWSVFPFSLPPSVIFCPPPPLFLHNLPPFLFSRHVFPLSLYHSFPFSLLPPTSSLLAPNSCCCARMGLNLTQVWMARKKAFLCPSASFFIFINRTVKFSGGSEAPQITFPCTWLIQKNTYS